MTSTEVATKGRGKAAAKPTAQALAPVQTPGFSYIPAGLQERADYIARLAPSTILPTAYRGNAANAFVAAETGAALGLEPLQALASIAVINGRATLSSDLMAAVIRRAGHTLRIVENSPESVTATLIRADDKTFKFEVTWDKDKATKAGLWGQPPLFGWRGSVSLVQLRAGGRRRQAFRRARPPSAPGRRRRNRHHLPR